MIRLRTRRGLPPGAGWLMATSALLLWAGCPGPTGGPGGTARPGGGARPGDARHPGARGAAPPHRMQAQLDQGLRALKRRPTADYPACVAAYTQVLKQDPKHRVARLNLAYCTLRLGHLAAAEAAYVAADPNRDRRALLGLLEVQVRRRRLKEALAHANRWLKAHPRDRRVLGFAAAILRRLGRRAAALQRIQQALAVNRKDAFAHVQFGRLYLDRKDPRTALMIFGRGLRYHPHSARLRFARGQAWWRLGEMGKAVMDFEAAVRRDPGFVAARLHLGKIYVDNLDYKGALAHFQAVVDRWPHHLEAQLGVGRALFGLKRFKPALAAYQRVLAQSPAEPRALFQIAKIYQGSLDQPRQALIYYRKFVSARPGLSKRDPVFATIKMLEAMTRAARRRAPPRRRGAGGPSK